MKNLDVYVGDVDYYLYFELTDDDGNVVDITDSTVYLMYGYGETPINKVQRLCTIISATLGTVKYKVIASDFTAEASCPSQIQIRYNSGETVTLNEFMITVLPSRKP